jgi:hypothetical protein
MTAAVNHTGAIINSGSGSATTAISAAIGSNVTGATQSSNTSALVMSGNLNVNLNGTTLTNSSTRTLALTGGATGTGNLVLDAGPGVINVTTTAINNTGTISNTSSGSGITTISAAVGSNVTGITQNSSTSAVIFSGALTVNSNGTTLTNNSTRTFALSGGTTGTGDLILKANNRGVLNVTTTAVNHTGAIVNSGTGSGTSTISAAIGSSVATITQSSNISAFVISGVLAVNSSGTTLTSGNTRTFQLKGGTTDTGNLILNANSTGVINVTTAALNNIGAVINSGTGSGTTTITAAIGSNVSAVYQLSSTSALIVNGTIVGFSGET